MGKQINKIFQIRNTLLLTSILIILLSFSSHGQEIDWDRYEVGVDLLWIIKRNNAPISFYIKHIQLKQSKKDFGFVRRGYRLRIGGNYRRPNEETQVSGSFYLRKSSYSFIVRPGYEWHKKIKSFDVFYGADINLQFSGQTNENTSVFLNAGNGGYYYTFFNQRDRYMNIGLAPILGMSIKIIKGLNLTLESTVNISYIRDVSSYSDNNNFDDIRVEGNGFAFDIYPLYTLNASFIF